MIEVYGDGMLEVRGVVKVSMDIHVNDFTGWPSTSRTDMNSA
jgi:hypothetical protein